MRSGFSPHLKQHYRSRFNHLRTSAKTGPGDFSWNFRRSAYWRKTLARRPLSADFPAKATLFGFQTLSTIIVNNLLYNFSPRLPRKLPSVPGSPESSRQAEHNTTCWPWTRKNAWIFTSLGASWPADSRTRVKAAARKFGGTFCQPPGSLRKWLVMPW